jgi:hypothetical protein
MKTKLALFTAALIGLSTYAKGEQDNLYVDSSMVYGLKTQIWLGNASQNVVVGRYELYYGKEKVDAVSVDARNFSETPFSVDATRVTTESLLKGGRIGFLVNKYLYGQDYRDTKEDATVLQLAVLDVVYDDGDGLETGRFRAKISPKMAYKANKILQESTKNNEIARYFVSNTAKTGEKYSLGHNFVAKMPNNEVFAPPYEYLGVLALTIPYKPDNPVPEVPATLFFAAYVGFAIYRLQIGGFRFQSKK